MRLQNTGKLQELKKLLLEKYSSEEMPLSNFILKKCLIVLQMILANYSLDSQQQVINIPSIIETRHFPTCVIGPKTRQVSGKAGTRIERVRLNLVPKPATFGRNLVLKSSTFRSLRSPRLPQTDSQRYLEVSAVVK